MDESTWLKMMVPLTIEPRLLKTLGNAAAAIVLTIAIERTRDLGEESWTMSLDQWRDQTFLCEAELLGALFYVESKGILQKRTDGDQQVYQINWDALCKAHEEVFGEDD